ncbi:O-antigen ligase family protein [Nitrospira sp. KM1]|uniref:O-antigen ligase family protein n=1 Tax=Nitrospira sp. KM1 TaxID=1936990 RepID=UPI00156575E3|nr:O-antigen ligase family protein [Nitrospira sp. KM1]
MTATPSRFLSHAGAVTTLKRYLLSWDASGVLLGGLIVFSPLIDGGTTHAPNCVMRMVLFGSLLIWLFRQIKTGTVGLRRHRLYVFSALYFLWAALSLWWAPYKNAGTQGLLTLLMYMVLLGAVLEGVQDIRQAQFLIMLLMAMGLWEGVLGLAQYMWLDEVRAKGTFFNPNFFASYEVAIFAWALVQVLFRPADEMHWWKRVLLWSVVVVTCGAFMAAQSRGVLAAFIAVAVYIGFARFGRVSLVPLAVLLLGLVLFPNPLKERFISAASSDPYAYSRVDIWKSSIERLIDQPFGYGLGMFKYTSFQYRFPIEQNIVWYEKRAESAHNEYLQIGVELGIIGLGLFLVGLWSWWQAVRRNIRDCLTANERALFLGASGSVIAILVHGLVDSVFHEPALVVILVVCGGIALLPCMRKNEELESRWQITLVPNRLHVAGLTVCAVVLAILVFQPVTGFYLHGKGEQVAASGNDEDALKWFERASLIDPGTTAYHDAIARTSTQLFRQSNDPQWLLKAMDEEIVASALNPLDGRFPYRLGTIYMLLAAQRTYEQHRVALRRQAEESFEQAALADPFSPFNCLELGRIRVAQGRIQEGRQWLEKGIMMEPNFLPARVLLTELSLESGDQQDARLHYERILSIKRQYEKRTLSALERQYLDVDLYPLGRAITLGVHP